MSSFARVSAHAVERVRESLSDDDDEARSQLDAAFARMERRQPAISSHVGEVLGRPLDETALALGYFLALSVWLAFEEAHADHIDEVSAEAIGETEQLLMLDEELRKSDASDPMDTDDVVAMEQPAIMEMVHEQISTTLESHGTDVDLEDVQVVYGLILVVLLSLSYAVQRPAGFPIAKTELLA